MYIIEVELLINKNCKKKNDLLILAPYGSATPLAIAYSAYAMGRPCQ